MSLARQSLRSSFCALCRSHAPFSTSARALEEAASGPRKESTQQPSATQTPARSEAARSTGSSRRWTPSAQQRRSAVEALKDLLSGVARQGVAKDSQQGRYQARQEAVDSGLGRVVPLYQGKALRPGDLNWRRMFAGNLPTHKSNLNSSTLGPTRKEAVKTDFFVRSGNINPLAEPLNPGLHSRFVTNMGKIMNRAQTGLTWKNQRRMGKAVRRARAMGVTPYFADWSSPQVKHEKEQAFGMWQTGL